MGKLEDLIVQSTVTGVAASAMYVGYEAIFSEQTFGDAFQSKEAISIGLFSALATSVYQGIRNIIDKKY